MASLHKFAVYPLSPGLSSLHRGQDEKHRFLYLSWGSHFSNPHKIRCDQQTGSRTARDVWCHSHTENPLIGTHVVRKRLYLKSLCSLYSQHQQILFWSLLNHELCYPSLGFCLGLSLLLLFDFAGAISLSFPLWVFYSKLKAPPQPSKQPRPAAWSTSPMRTPRA